jgi:uncharacterized protein involved in outer membrane biogenesis
MKVSLRKWVVVLLAGIILLPVAAYWLADSWLESSGGRRMLEQTLTARIGMSVRLEGEFDLMLFPAIGVTGTELVIGGPEPGTELARSHEFEISVALKPLLDRQVLVEWIRLTGGSIHPKRYSRTNDIDVIDYPDRMDIVDPTVGADSSANLALPEIQELTIRDFQIILSNEDETRLHIKELTLTNFAQNRATPFTLEIEDLATTAGTLRWDTSQSLIHLGSLQLDLAGQLVRGTACLFLQTPVSLHLDLQAGAFDLDAFRESLPGTGASAGQGSGDLPLEIRARFAVDELKTSGVLARGVVLSLGGEPACD